MDTYYFFTLATVAGHNLSRSREETTTALAATPTRAQTAQAATPTRAKNG